MYTLSQLRKGLSHPNLVAREINGLFFDLISAEQVHRDGVDVLSEDWDNLIILDACRYDLFESTNELAGELLKVRSKGTNTVEFLEGNFTDRNATDTVYVTGNPQLYRHYDEINPGFHHVENVWEAEGWDEELGTVMPEPTRRRAAAMADAYPNKRLIAHYVQPHYPFVTLDTEFDKVRLYDPKENISIWQAVMKGEVDIDMETLWAGYRDNLRIALESVQGLLESLHGKTVITSDHGNVFGERSFPIPIREYGHPRGMYLDELLTVPWFVPEYEGRKEIVDEGVSDEAVDIESDAVDERLASLGYK